MPLNYASYDDFLAALCIWREARGEPYAVKQAVAFVLWNRLNDPKNRWPKRLASVVLQPLQFSSFNANDPNATKLPDPTHELDWEAWQEAQTALDSVYTANPGQDPTEGATNFYNSSIPTPSWAEGKPSVKIGDLYFLKA
jgi:N-acetylmuramoyl-L-alanine amidase